MKIGILVLGFLVNGAISTLALADDPPTVGRIVAIVQTAAGAVLAGGNDFTAYTFDRDEPGVSNCNGPCAVTWPPVLTDLAALPPPFGIVVRVDSGRQISYQGKPLYLYARDTAVGQTGGDGVGGVWHLARLE